MILLLLDTGIRNEELCNIKLHNLDERNQRLYIFGKGAKEHYVPFSARTHQALWRYLTLRPDANLNESLFLMENGRPFIRRGLSLIRAAMGEGSRSARAYHRMRSVKLARLIGGFQFRARFPA